MVMNKTFKNKAFKLRSSGLTHAKLALASWHGRIVLLGLAVGLLYFHVWTAGMLVRASQGSAGIPLMGSAVFIGLRQLWKNRHGIAQLESSEEDRAIGHLLIIGGVILYPFCRFAIWPQSIIWLVILAGIVVSSWGVRFFEKYSLPTFLILLTAYPKPGVFARTIWAALTPHLFLERIMANAGAASLRMLGFPANVEGIIVTLPPNGAVEVGFGCNGFNMAFTMAAAGLIMGLFYKQSWPKIVAIVLVGIVLALLFNVPRIMMLTIAAIHWGDASFDFWHGGWGSQIFSAILFTPYYYAVMAIINRDSKTKA
ncbi:exosortase/archaeosortase family protein [filamentous cyanobacterium CCP3]|nr:exosortase/archaeosortase family protein [filamentous cyanobacterium CCP3]